MRIKKSVALLLTFVIVFSLMPSLVFAEENVISYTAMINGENYYGDDKVIEKNEEITLSVQDVTLNDNIPEASEVSYQWSKAVWDESTKTEVYNPIAGATSSEYQFIYDGGYMYSCMITIGLESTSMNFSLKEDTLSISGISNPPSTLDKDGMNQMYDVPVGQTVTLTVNAVSTVPNAQLTYTWDYMPIGTGFTPPVNLNNNTNICTFKKDMGKERYSCTVSDGNIIKSLEFYINPSATLQITPMINGLKPECFERGYMFVAKAGEEVTMEVNAVSSNSEVTYKWEKYVSTFSEDTGYQQTVTEVGTSDSLTVTKEDIPGDEYSFEQYECFINDGNEKIDAGFVLFSISPNQVMKAVDIEGGALAISIENDIENLSNNLLRNRLNALSTGAEAQIRLTARPQNDIAEDKKDVIDTALPVDSKVGMYLDINLYSRVTGGDQAEIISEASSGKGNDGEKQITETGNEINLSVSLPQSLINSDTGVTRTYQVVRMHNDVAELLDSKFDAENGRLTFGTDKFSIYALAYKDEANHTHVYDQKNTSKEFLKSEATCQKKAVYYKSCICGEKGTETFESGQLKEHQWDEGKVTIKATDQKEGIKTYTCTVCGETRTETIPKLRTALKTTLRTGDDNNIILWVGLILVSCIGVVGISIYTKKRNS